MEWTYDNNFLFIKRLKATINRPNIYFVSMVTTYLSYKLQDSTVKNNVNHVNKTHKTTLYIKYNMYRNQD